MHDLIILIPSFNEVQNLKKIIKKKYDFLIIDDNSTDGTQELLKKNKIKYIRNTKNIGYEKSIIKGFKNIKKNIDYVLTIDGDGEHPINNIKKILNFAKKNNADLVVCNRNKFNRFLEKVFSYFFYIKYKIKDPLSGMKLYYMPSLKKILSKTDKINFLVDIIINSIKKNFIIKNYNISSQKKIGSSKIGNSIYVQIKLITLFKFLF